MSGTQAPVTIVIQLPAGSQKFHMAMFYEDMFFIPKGLAYTNVRRYKSRDRPTRVVFVSKETKAIYGYAHVGHEAPLASRNRLDEEGRWEYGCARTYTLFFFVFFFYC